MGNIVELAQATLSDIPKVLREIADEIEDGTYGTVVAGVISLECSTRVLEIFGAGTADKYRALAILAGSQNMMVQRIYGVNDNSQI